jgi:hypothetical protein
MIIETLTVLGILGGLRAIATSKNPASPDEVDREERSFYKQQLKRGHEPSQIRRYMDHKRDLVGRPRRPGVNADILPPRNDAEWTIKPGEDLKQWWKS